MLLVLSAKKNFQSSDRSHQKCRGSSKSTKLHSFPGESEASLTEAAEKPEEMESEKVRARHVDAQFSMFPGKI